MIRNITGRVGDNWTSVSNGSGVFSIESGGVMPIPGTSNGQYMSFPFNASRVVPTGSQTKPRAYGIQACIYLGS